MFFNKGSALTAALLIGDRCGLATQAVIADRPVIDFVRAFDADDRSGMGLHEIMQPLGDSGGVDFPLGAEDELHAGFGRIAEMRLAVGVGSGVGGMIADGIKAKIVESLNNFSDIGIFSVGVVDMRINSKGTNNIVYSNGLSHKLFSRFTREVAMGMNPHSLAPIRFNTRGGSCGDDSLSMIYCCECGSIRIVFIM
jgi:hypothetical protein